MRALSIGVALIVATLGIPATTAQESTPPDSDVVERVSSELGSVSFVLTPKNDRKARRAIDPEERMAELQRIATSLGPDDLYLRVGGRTVVVDSVDPICDLLSEDIVAVEAADPSTISDPGDVYAVSRARPILYTFYLDRAYLTMSGFQNALYQATELARDVVRPQDYVSLVFNGRRQEIEVPLTRDVNRITSRLRAIKADTKNPKYNIFPPEQTLFSRLEDIRWSANPELTARDWARYEDREILRSLDRLEITLRAMETPLQDVEFVDKVMFYFADMNVGRKAGQFYTDIANQRNRDPISQGAFDRVTRQANASGVKLYTVQAAGQGALEGSTQRIGSEVSDSGASLQSIVRYGREALLSLAAETGGRAFVAAGANVDTIVQTLRDDLRCRVYVNFRLADGTPRNRVQAVDLEWDRKEIPDLFNVRSQGQFVISDGDTRRANRAMAELVGFSTQGGSASEEAIYFLVRPRRFEDDEVDLEIQHIVRLDRAISEFRNSDDGITFTGENADLQWAFEHYRKYRDDRLGRQKPVVVSNLSDGRVVFLSYVRERLDDSFGFYATGGVVESGFRRSEATEQVGLPRIKKERRRYKIEEPEEPLSISFMQPMQAYLMTEKESGVGNKNVGVAHQMKVIDLDPTTKAEEPVALVEPEFPLIIEYPVCRTRDREAVSFKVTINGDVMQFDEAAAVMPAKKGKRTGELELGKQACTLKQDVISIEQIGDAETLNNGNIHRYQVEVFQGGSSTYTMTKFFKVQP